MKKILSFIFFIGVLLYSVQVEASVLKINNTKLANKIHKSLELDCHHQRVKTIIKQENGVYRFGFDASSDFNNTKSTTKQAAPKLWYVKNMD